MSASHIALRELRTEEARWTTTVSKLKSAIKSGVVLSGHSTIEGQQEALEWAEKRLKAIKTEIKRVGKK